MATDGSKAPATFSRGETNPSLPGKAKGWATPRATDGEKGGPNQSFTDGGGIPLSAQVANWDTPTVACAMGGQVNRGGSRQEELLIGGQAQAVSSLLALETSTPGATSSDGPRTLNPRFVEWLMNWPPGWTNFACSVMAFILYREHMRSAFLQLGLPPKAPPVQQDLFG